MVPVSPYTFLSARVLVLMLLTIAQKDPLAVERWSHPSVLSWFLTRRWPTGDRCLVGAAWRGTQQRSLTCARSSLNKSQREQLNLEVWYRNRIRWVGTPPDVPGGWPLTRITFLTHDLNAFQASKFLNAFRNFDIFSDLNSFQKGSLRFLKGELQRRCRDGRLNRWHDLAVALLLGCTWKGSWRIQARYSKSKGTIWGKCFPQVWHTHTHTLQHTFQGGLSGFAFRCRHDQIACNLWQGRYTLAWDIVFTSPYFGWQFSNSHSSNGDFGQDWLHTKLFFTRGIWHHNHKSIGTPMLHCVRF